MKLTKKQKEYINRLGYNHTDYTQIEKSSRFCKYYVCVGNNECRISKKQAIEKVGENSWLSGVARAAFHHTAMRNEVLFVCDLF